MCGFAGEFVFGPGRADLALAEKMASALAHRGPDEEGSFLSENQRCAIGFRRLAVIDPAGSHQPMTSADGNVTVAMNGEIYNYRQLRAQLASDGAAFQTAGDTEVLIHLYRRHGQGLASRLAGMFAFVIYDAANDSLVLGRDRLGQKPLWYATLADRLVFASEAKALLRHIGVSTSIDQSAVAFYLALGYIPAPRSIWAGIYKLMPGSILRLAGGAATTERYWAPQQGAAQGSRDELLLQVRQVVVRAVEAAMVSDVPLGVLLSGGLDSSIVTAAMAKAAGRAGGVRTFTATFEQKAFDESQPARAVARHCRTDHTEMLVAPAPDQAIDDVLRMYDEPFADSSAVPTSLICRQARAMVTVALSGDGGDEVFAGYDRYRALELAAGLTPAGYLGIKVASAISRPFARGSDRTFLRRLVRFGDGLALPSAMQYLQVRSLFGPEDLPCLLTAEFAETADLDEPARWFCELYEDCDVDDEASHAQRHDMLTYLPDDLLVKSDRASMASSLELRCPLLEEPVVRLGLSLPLGLRVSRWRGKIALREAFRDMLPRDILRRPKRGFGVPLGNWLRHELRGTMIETLTDPSLSNMGIFRPGAIAGLINDHVRERGDHGHRLWALIVLARWLLGRR